MVHVPPLLAALPIPAALVGAVLLLQVPPTPAVPPPPFPGPFVDSGQMWLAGLTILSGMMTTALLLYREYLAARREERAVAALEYR